MNKLRRTSRELLFINKYFDGQLCSLSLCRIMANGRWKLMIDAKTVLAALIREIKFSIPLKQKLARMILKQIAAQKLCHKCYKLASRGETRLVINVWPSHKQTGSCVICTSFKEQQKPGRKKKSKPGVKPATKDVSGSKEQAEMTEGMFSTGRKYQYILLKRYKSWKHTEEQNIFIQNILLRTSSMNTSA